MATSTKPILRVLLPERTVDSLFAYEFLSAAPQSLIWSPANNHRDPFGLSPDHLLVVPGFDREIVMECKTLYARDADDDWFVRIDRAQLKTYAAVSPATLYLLPADSRHRKAPWARFGCCTSGVENCTACELPRSRRWGWESQIADLPRHVGFQPWFSHWAWCVDAVSLQSHVAVHGRDLPARDDYLGSIPGAIRLCHLLGAITVDATGFWPSDSPADLELPGERLRFLFSVAAEVPPRIVPTITGRSRAMLATYQSYGRALAAGTH